MIYEIGWAMNAATVVPQKPKFVVRKGLAGTAGRRKDLGKIESGVTQAAREGLAAEDAEEPVERAVCRGHAMGVAIRTEEDFRIVIHRSPLRILNADAQSVAGFLLRLEHALLDLADHGLGGLHFLASLLKPGEPLVDELIAKQLIGSER